MAELSKANTIAIASLTPGPHGLAQALTSLKDLREISERIFNRLRERVEQEQTRCRTIQARVEDLSGRVATHAGSKGHVIYSAFQYPVGKHGAQAVRPPSVLAEFRGYKRRGIPSSRGEGEGEVEVDDNDDEEEAMVARSREGFAQCGAVVLPIHLTVRASPADADDETTSKELYASWASKSQKLLRDGGSGLDPMLLNLTVQDATAGGGATSSTNRSVATASSPSTALRSEGLGRIPAHVDSVASLLLFNTQENLYQAYRFLDPMEQQRHERRRKEASETSVALSAAPANMRGDLGKVMGENINFQPTMEAIPEFDLPDNLPGLEDIADVDWDYGLAGAMDTIIAPSDPRNASDAQSTAHSIRAALPSMRSSHGLTASTPSLHTRTSTARGGGAASMTAPPVVGRGVVPPPPPTSGGPMVPPPPPPPPHSSSGLVVPPPPPPPPASFHTSAMPPPPPGNLSIKTVPPPPPPPPSTLASQPPLPPAPTLGSGQSTAAASLPAPQSGRDALMAAIRNANKSQLLKKVGEGEPSDPSGGGRPATTASKSTSSHAALAQKLLMRGRSLRGEALDDEDEDEAPPKPIPKLSTQTNKPAAPQAAPSNLPPPPIPLARKKVVDDEDDWD